MIPHLALATPFALIASLAYADVTGSYSAQGRNPDGSAYSGSAELVQEDGYVSIRWTIGGQTYTGRGPLNGDVVTIDWGDTAPLVYVIMPDGELHGTWADGAALDKLTPR